jgi:hemolysin III
MTVIHSADIPEFGDCFRLKDPASALTHFCGFILAVFGLAPLLIRASVYGGTTAQLASFAVFMLSMILLYGASSSYHAFNLSGRGNLILKKIDHLSISVLIAGTYTPICVCGLPEGRGMILLKCIWFCAAAGMLFKLFWVTCPRWVSSVLYVLMGWMCLTVLPDLFTAFYPGGFIWLLAGGLFYTAGSLFYAGKKQVLIAPGFANHEIFHCFVLAGSFCHYIFIYQYLTAVL